MLSVFPSIFSALIQQPIPSIFACFIPTLNSAGLVLMLLPGDHNHFSTELETSP